MKHTGPQVTYLMHRLLNAPQAIVAKPFFFPGKAFVPSTAVMVSDLLYELGGNILSIYETDYFKDSKSKIFSRPHENLLMIIQVVCYILADPWFSEYSVAHRELNFAGRAKQFIFKGLEETAKVQKAEFFLKDAEGREEICRKVLAILELIPAGESEIQSRDRLTALDSVERWRVVEKTKEAQRRAKELLEAIRRREAEEAASKMSRE